MAGLELWWLGQAGFRLRDPGHGPTIFCDPFLTRSDRRTWQAPVDAAALAHADLVLVSHEHTDHLDRPTLKAAAAAPGSRFSLVVPRPLLAELASELGLPPDRLVGAQPDTPIERLGVRISPVPACHGVNVADAYTFGEDLTDSNGLVRYLGYVVELGGVRVYHAGDCIPYAGQVERLRALEPQVALLPINGRDFFRETEHNIVGNMDYREAARLASDIGVQLLIPMHWELFAHNRGYPDHLVGYVAENFPELSVLLMGRGTTFTYVPTAVP
jgi:L-ascorbate metabolism protein UlaG (beta-lactamase superfamily)